MAGSAGNDLASHTKLRGKKRERQKSKTGLPQCGQQKATILEIKTKGGKKSAVKAGN